MQRKTDTIIDQLINKLGITQAEFAKAIGITPNGVTNMKNRKIGHKSAQKIMDAFPQVNLAWLLTGDGNILKELRNAEVAPKLGYLSADKIEKDVVPAKTVGRVLYTTTKAGLEFYQNDDGSLTLRAPIVPQSVLGSMPSEWEEETNLYDECEWEDFPVDAVHHGRYYAFRVSGDSMDDGTRRGFESGDIVLVRELPKDEWAPSLHIRRWPFWVVAFGNNVRIKEIVAQDEKTGAITLHSLNPSPEYTDFQLGLDEIDRLFNVVQHKPHPRSF